MEFFTCSKYQTIDENIPYSAMNLYNLIDGKITIDELFEKYSQERNMVLSVNLEEVLLLSLTFLFSLGKIAVKDMMIERCN